MTVVAVRVSRLGERRSCTKAFPSPQCTRLGDVSNCSYVSIREDKVPQSEESVHHTAAAQEISQAPDIALIRTNTSLEGFSSIAEGEQFNFSFNFALSPIVWSRAKVQ